MTEPLAARGRGGFTIVHLSIILAGLTAIASLAIPKWFGRDVVTLDSAAILLARDLYEVQNRAAFQRSALNVVFFADGSGYEVQDADGRPVRATIGNGPFRRIYSRDGVFRGVRIAEPPKVDDATLRFGRRGFLMDGGRIVLTFGGHSRTVRMDERTGRIDVVGLKRPWDHLGH